MARNVMVYDSHEIREAFAKAIGADPCNVTLHFMSEPEPHVEMYVDQGAAKPKRVHDMPTEAVHDMPTEAVHDMHTEAVLAELLEIRVTYGAFDSLTCSQISGRTGIQGRWVEATLERLKGDGRVESTGLDPSGEATWAAVVR